MRELPGLEPYKRSLERLIEEKAHRLSPETEKVLASLGEVLDSPYRIYQRGKLADMTFEEVLDGEDQSRPLSWSFTKTITRCLPIPNFVVPRMPPLLKR